MKRALTITGLFFLLGCQTSHIEEPLIVKSISLNENSTHSFKYEITFDETCNSGDPCYYTNIKYKVGDTLK